MNRLWVILLVPMISGSGCEGLDALTGAGPAYAGRSSGFGGRRPDRNTDTRVAREPPRKPDTPTRRPVLRPRADLPPAVESYAVCTFDTLTVPRSQVHDFDQMFTYTETGGVFGPDARVLGLNGLRIARLDLRFKEPFAKALATARGDSRRVTYVRLPEQKDQNFELGDALKNVSLFVWTSPDAVIGRHFAQARYSLTLRLEKVSPEGVVEYGLSWQAHTGANYQRTVTIPTLDLHAELEKGQSLLIAPTGVAGRSVDRALLSGMEESTVQVTCVVITPTEARAKPVPKPEEPAEVADAP